MNIQTITRCFTSFNNSVVKVKRFNFMYHRLNIYLIGGAILGAFIYLNLYDADFIKERSLALNPKAELQSGYELYSLHFSDFDSYYESVKRHVHSAYWLIGSFTVITLLPWLLFIVWRPAPPICFDRKRQLVYTWHKGKLYAAKMSQLQIELKNKSSHIEFAGGWGPMIISLFPAGKVFDKNGKLRKGKRIPIGTFIPQYNYQNHDLKPFIENYMAGNLNIPSDIQPSKSFLEYAPRKPKELPSDDTLDKAIQDWLSKEK